MVSVLRANCLLAAPCANAHSFPALAQNTRRSGHRVNRQQRAARIFAGGIDNVIGRWSGIGMASALGSIWRGAALKNWRNKSKKTMKRQRKHIEKKRRVQAAWRGGRRNRRNMKSESHQASARLRFIVGCFRWLFWTRFRFSRRTSIYRSRIFRSCVDISRVARHSVFCSKHGDIHFGTLRAPRLLLRFLCIVLRAALGAFTLHYSDARTSFAAYHAWRRKDGINIGGRSGTSWWFSIASISRNACGLARPARHRGIMASRDGVCASSRSGT